MVRIDESGDGLSPFVFEGLGKVPNLRPGLFKDQVWGLMAERGVATNVVDVEGRLSGVLNSHGVNNLTAFKVVHDVLWAAISALTIEGSQQGVLVALGLQHRGNSQNLMEALDYDQIQVDVLAALKREFAAQSGSLVPDRDGRLSNDPELLAIRGQESILVRNTLRE